MVQLKVEKLVTGSEPSRPKYTREYKRFQLPQSVLSRIFHAQDLRRTIEATSSVAEKMQ